MLHGDVGPASQRLTIVQTAFYGFLHHASLSDSSLPLHPFFEAPLSPIAFDLPTHVCMKTGETALLGNLFTGNLSTA